MTLAAVATLPESFARDLVAGPVLKLVAGAGFIVIGAFIIWGALPPA